MRIYIEQIKLKSSQTVNSNLKTVCEVRKAELKELRSKVKQLEAEEKRLSDLLQASTESEIEMQLKDHKGEFKRELIKCVIELMGEHEVSATRCSEVIQCVCRHLFGNIISSE